MINSVDDGAELSLHNVDRQCGARIDLALENREDLFQLLCVFDAKDLFLSNIQEGRH